MNYRKKYWTLMSFCVFGCLVVLSGSGMAQGDMAVADLKCEYQVNPLGIDVQKPRLSWLLTSDQRGQRQTAYRILVASGQEVLEKNKGDVWDSGRVESGRSIQIEYSGKSLDSNRQYFWKVKVWGVEDAASEWSDAAHWTMGVLNAEEWQARWIAMPEKTRIPEYNIKDAKWIWGFPAGKPAGDTAPGFCGLFRKFNLPETAAVVAAHLLVTADNFATVELNGKTVAKITQWESGKIVDLKALLVPGLNELKVLAENGGSGMNPAGVICKVTINLADGNVIEIVSDKLWSVAPDSKTGEVLLVNEIAPWGAGPWGAQSKFSGPGEGLPVFRKSFTVANGASRALVNVAGLGHYELFLNGRKVGDHFLDAPWSVYERTVYYSTYDITGLLQQGSNELRIMLGKGFYNTQGDRRVHGVNNTGRLMTILQGQIEYADGRTESIITDESWDAARGPVTHSAILAGSDFDGSEIEPREWVKADVADCPGRLIAAESPAMKMFERLAPVKSAEEPESGVFVYDFGQNLSAIPSIKVRGREGQVVRLTPAEQRHGQSDRHNNGTGRVNQAGVGSPNYYEYTLNGQEIENWQPQFTYGGFQYIELTGAVPQGHPNPGNLPVLEEIKSVHVRSSAEAVGSFACSKPLFEKIDESIDRAVRSNLAHVLTDCPTREKLGWLEVAYLMGPSISRRYDLTRLYAKITRDIRDSQGADGEIYTVAPNYPKFNGGFRYTPEWGAAGVVVPWQLYRWYGDKRVLQENFAAMKTFVDYMKKSGKDLVPAAGLGDWYDYGHGKGSGPAKFTSPELTAMATFYRCAGIVADSAKVLEKEDDLRTYRKLADDIRVQFNRKFYVGDGEYRNHGSPQTANAMALVTGLCEAANEQAVLDAILKDLKKRNYQQTAGDVGFHYLVEALSRYNCNETVYKMLDRNTEGSYGFILDRGWTSLPEAWDANTGASMNHCMLGHIQQWFYCDLLGIRQADDSAGFREIIIKPAFETGLEWAKGHYDSVNGRIGVDWKKEDGRLHLKVVIPVNTTAVVYVPCQDVSNLMEGGQSLTRAGGIEFLGMKGDRTLLRVGSGSYAFACRVKRD